MYSDKRRDEVHDGKEIMLKEVFFVGLGRR